MKGALVQLEVAGRASAGRSHDQQLLSLMGSTAAAGLPVLLWLRTALGLHRSLANRRLFRQLLASRLGQPDRGPDAVLFADIRQSPLTGGEQRRA